jgi:acrylyl-CoA reductase (NADPH)
VKAGDFRDFRALVVRQAGEGQYERRVSRRSVEELPPGELLVRVRYSSLNYKDALSAAGHRGVTRRYPHTPGVDAAGVVVENSAAESPAAAVAGEKQMVESPAGEAGPGRGGAADTPAGRFAPGQEVLVQGFDLGVNTPGGFGQLIRVPTSWAVPRPEGLSLRQCMIYGTAGFTAALCVRALEEAGVRPGQGEVLVTGATGGVGSVAVAILARQGFRVAAATGKSAEEYLRSLGAARVVAREEVEDSSGKPLLSGRWAGVVDTVGGNILATALKSTLYAGAVAACGNAASGELATTVYPFILRGVRLQGIDSVRCPPELRRSVWARLAGPWKPDALEGIAAECTLEELDAKIDLILAGKLRGRVVVDLGG